MERIGIWVLLVGFIAMGLYAFFGLWSSRLVISVRPQREAISSIPMASTYFEREVALLWPSQRIYLRWEKGLYGVLGTFLASESNQKKITIVVRYSEIFSVFEVLDRLFQENVMVPNFIQILYVEDDPSAAFVEFNLRDTLIIETRADFPFSKGLSHQQEACWDVYGRELPELSKIQDYFLDSRIRELEGGFRLYFQNAVAYRKGTTHLKKLIRKTGFQLENVLERNSMKPSEGVISPYRYALPEGCHYLGLGYRQAEDSYAYMEQLSNILKSE